MEIRPIVSTLLRSRTGPLLVALQVAISLAILANALFIVQERIAISKRPTGIANERDVGQASIFVLQRLAHADSLAQQDRGLQVVRAIPGVVSAALTSQMPISRSGSSGSVRVDPRQTEAPAEPSLYLAPPGLVATMGLRLVEGRDLNDADVVEFDPLTMGYEVWPKSVVITQALGKALFPDAASYVGRSFFFGADTRRQVRIVGVIERLQTHMGQPSALAERSLLLPMRTSGQFWRYVIRAEPGQLDRVLKEAEEALRKASPTPARTSARTATKDRGERYRNERALAWMLVAISVLLLLVTMSGIVGMTALRVDQRRKQIGVRRALGARWRDILRYFIVENFIITTGGIVAGLLLALALNRLLVAHAGMARLPLEYLAYGAVALWALGIAAVYGPASRAASTSPAIATRTA